MSLFRVYAPDELGSDGYPRAWHRLPLDEPLTEFLSGERDFGIKHIVRADAGHRCVRCGHPYRNGEHGSGEWSPCDEQCSHGMPARCDAHPFTSLGSGATTGGLLRDATAQGYVRVIEAQWRILTVHHLDGDKANCRWWNLAALCQRCHLTIQGLVVMDRPFHYEHSAWFKPYAAGFYAAKYLGVSLDRATVEARLDELLALEGNTPRLFA